MFALANAAKSYGGRVALGPLSLEIPVGKTTVLIGPSGCGKSTLLRMLIGLVAPDSGSVSFGGKPVVPETVREVRLQVGYVIQDGGLFPHLTSRNNAALLARHLGWPQPQIDARIDELATLARIPADVLARRPHQLSGGQKQRVALIRALMLDPSALLLDEPFAALDPLVRAEMRLELRESFRSLGKTVVLVTHDLAEAAFFADRVVLLRDGQIVQTGPPGDLWHRPADPFVTRFVEAQRGPEVPA